MKSKLIVYLLFVTSFLSAQSVDDYAAVIVPLKFDFQNSENEYRLSTFTKFNLEKAGFKAVYSNTDYAAQYPNRCSLLSLDLVRVSGFLNTKLYVSFKDCYGKEVYRSETGKSLEKEFDVAYKEALNLAFESIYRLEYKFNGKNSPQLPATIKEVEIKESTKPVVEEVEKAIVTPPTKNANVNLLYAQPTANGYQLIDKTPKVIMKLITTDDPTVFKAFKGDEEGVLSQRDNKWIFDSFKKDRFSEVLHIKF